MKKGIETDGSHSGGILRVGDGRGFVVPSRCENFGNACAVITAAHCLKQLPPPHPGRYTEEATYARILGPLNAAKPEIWAECLFVDPINDIAVLGCPDEQEFSEQADAYHELMDDAPEFMISAPPQEGGEPSFQLLALDGKWVEASMKIFRCSLSLRSSSKIKCGMSGSPIIDANGKAIALVSTDNFNPILAQCLPVWLWKALRSETI